VGDETDVAPAAGLLGALVEDLIHLGRIGPNQGLHLRVATPTRTIGGVGVNRLHAVADFAVELLDAGNPRRRQRLAGAPVIVIMRDRNSPRVVHDAFCSWRWCEPGRRLDGGRVVDELLDRAGLTRGAPDREARCAKRLYERRSTTTPVTIMRMPIQRCTVTCSSRKTCPTSAIST
jgi:hypothetical protein